jgi:hypothetical protein
MATSSYFTGRKKYSRPQAVMWSKNAGYVSDGFYLPLGSEIGSLDGLESNPELVDQFIILSDHNRGPIDFTPNRIEQRQRMINGTMRSYHIADKKTTTIKWTMLPSRSSGVKPDYDADGIKDSSGNLTVDSGAGGAELLEWYENNKGPFWMFLSYDKFPDFGRSDEAYQRLNKYNERVFVYITDFAYTVVKRGQGTYDMWDVSVTLEEV